MVLLGLLVIDKPSGMTSRRAVDHVERLVRPAKAGHAGTLDPLATGVLVVGVGQATRLIEYVQRMPKQYRATFLLGRFSSTEDIEGEITELVEPPQPSREQVLAAGEQFVGEIEQRPPVFSALKVAGKRAYRLARAGKHVELAPRQVTIHAISVESYAYPALTLKIGCSSGTYVRSLGRDLAERLGTAAVMSALVRTQIGPFTLARASQLEDIAKENVASLLLNPLLALEGLPRLILSEAELLHVAHGRCIAAPPGPAGQEYAGVDHAGNLRAIMIGQPEGTLQVARNFATPS